MTSLDDYLADSRCSFSRLSGMLISPKECHHRMTSKEEPSDAFNLGGGFHCRVLEPGEYPRRYTCYEGTRNKRHKAYQEFLEQNPGKVVLKRSEADDIEAMAAAIDASPATTGLLDDLRHFERGLYWTNGHGLEMKCRLDASGPVGIIELKSTDDVAPRRFADKAFRFGYAMQAAIYQEAVAANDPEASTEHYTIAVQKKPPYDLVVYRASDEWLALGREQYDKCCEKYLACVESGLWPGVCEDIIEIHSPHWALVESDTFFDAEDSP